MKKYSSIILSLLLFSCEEQQKQAHESIPEPAWQEASWVSDRNSPQLSGCVEELGTQFHPLWEVKLKAGVYACGVMQQGKLYLGDEEGNLYCLDLKTGKTLWEKKFDEPFLSPFLLHQERLYVADDGGLIRAINTQNQEILWTYQGSDEKVAGGLTLASDGQSLIYGSYDFKLRALGLKDGAWQYELKTQNYINGSPSLLGEALVLMGGCDSYVRFLKPGMGEEYSAKLSSYIPSSLASDAERAYVCTYDGSVYALDGKAQIVWHYQPDKRGGNYETSPALTSKYVLTTESKGVVKLFDKEKGELRTQLKLPSSIAIPALVSEQLALICDEDGTLRLLELPQLNLVAQYRLGTSITAPLIFNKNILIACDDKGAVRCFHLTHASSTP